MFKLAVNVAVIQGKNILLTQREDFEIWALPGGGVEAGESIAQAALREAKEETGLDVELIRLVGIYSRLGNALSGHVVLFLAHPTGGKIRRQQGETIAVQWFPIDKIPAPLSMGHKKRIADAITGIGGSLCVAQEFDLPNYPQNIGRKELYALRDQSGLPRQEYYLQIIRDGSTREKTEVGGSRE